MNFKGCFFLHTFARVNIGYLEVNTWAV